jgi:type I restriction enzyme S subunit
VVEQDPEDEPAEEQLERIIEAKILLGRKERTTKKKRSEPSDESLDFPLPARWATSPLADLVTVLNGRAYKQSELLDTGTPVLRVGNLFTSNKWYYSDLELEEDKYCNDGDLIFAWSASFGPFIWNGGQAIYHYHIWKLPLHSPKDLFRDYLYLYLLNKTDEIKASGHGISMVHMTKEKMERLEVPLPPLAEQHRIVAKVDELMALCDQLEAARQQREQSRERLVAATLQRLNQPAADPASFRQDASFALQVLPSLTTTPAQIKQLRLTILNLAVRGKLVEQDPEDEPAEEWLRILSLHTHLDSRKSRRIQQDSDNNHLITLPRGWALSPFCKIARVKSNLVDPASHHEEPHIAPDCIESWTGRLLGFQTVGESGVTSPKHLFEPGVILYSKIRPNLAKAVKVDFGGLCSADMYPIEPLIDRDFLLKYMISSLFVEQATAGDNRVAMPKINQAALNQILVPLPPLAEQHRIVAKVDELMALCDQLEQQLSQADQQRRRLLEALLAEALGGRLPIEQEESHAAIA